MVLTNNYKNELAKVSTTVYNFLNYLLNISMNKHKFFCSNICVIITSIRKKNFFYLLILYFGLVLVVNEKKIILII